MLLTYRMLRATFVPFAYASHGIHELQSSSDTAATLVPLLKGIRTMADFCAVSVYGHRLSQERMALQTLQGAANKRYIHKGFVY